MRLLTFCLLLVSTLGAQTIIPLYPEGIPCANSLADKSIQREDIGRLITAVHTPLLEYHAPVPHIAKGGAIMIIPGGGYKVEAWGHEGEDIAHRFQLEGLHVFILQHRLPGLESAECRSHVALDDARRGVQTIRLWADSLKINLDQVAVMGFSAGGHLAASAAVHPIEANPEAIVPAERFSSRPDYSLPIYPVLIMEASKAAHQGSINNLLGKQPWDKELLAYYDLPGQVHAKVPPTFLVHAGNDYAVPVENSLRYYAALQQQKVPAALHIYPTGGHGFGSGRQLDSQVGSWLETALTWMRDYDLVR